MADVMNVKVYIWARVGNVNGCEKWVVYGDAYESTIYETYSYELWEHRISGERFSFAKLQAPGIVQQLVTLSLSTVWYCYVLDYLMAYVLFKKAEPITANSTDPMWKWFKNCLGALDGIHIKIRVPTVDKLRYRMRKCDIATNMLGVWTPDMHFVYVLPGWEGSVFDGRFLRDAISRRHGLKVPHGYYYLVDVGYTDCEGFLAPFRGQRYHLKKWRQAKLGEGLPSNVIDDDEPNILCQVFHNQVFLPKILEEPKGNGFQKKMLRWLPIWSTCTMLEPLMLIHDSKPAKPNIESRIRTLKRDWSIVYDMLSGKNNSSFGWDEHRQLVVAEDAVWNSYINSHKEASQFKHRSFPYYDQLTAIYAKDRATGKDAQTVDDIIEEIDVKDVATTNIHEERNNFYGCEADVSLDDMDVSATQL
ncbi:hypothetical protein GOBAR_DD35084 [Gossypium barbadense]|nr:hypothetical protein GOBAR_DD35084 [Gossypium barbadense]